MQFLEQGDKSIRPLQQGRPVAEKAMPPRRKRGRPEAASPAKLAKRKHDPDADGSSPPQPQSNESDEGILVGSGESSSSMLRCRRGSLTVRSFRSSRSGSQKLLQSLNVLSRAHNMCNSGSDCQVLICSCMKLGFKHVASLPESMTVKYVALLRGINVGTGKLVAMAKLALCLEGLGYRNVRTVLRSGNVVFESETSTLEPDAAVSVESAVAKATGVQASVILLNGNRFLAIADANPLAEVATDGSKSFVSFVAGTAMAMPEGLVRPEAKGLAPEVLEVGEGVVYQWIPAGWLKTAVPRSFWKQFEGPVTTRNWNTVQKIVALLR